LRMSDGVLFAVRSVRVEYWKPARFNEALAVTVEISGAKRASLHFEQAVLRGSLAGERLCAASVRIACLSADDLRPVAIPNDLYQRIRDEF
jgi:acyl-CoA thioester hydrolase